MSIICRQFHANFERLQVALNTVRTPLAAVIGAGGKTTVMSHWYRYLQRHGHPVVYTTTTQMWNEPDFVCCRDVRDFLSVCRRAAVNGSSAKIALASRGGKVIGIPPHWLNWLKRHNPGCTCIYEADGAKGRPIKGHADHEPVVAATTDILLIVVGGDGLGRRIADDSCHRPEQVARYTGLPNWARLGNQDLLTLLINDPGYLLRSEIGYKFFWLNKHRCTEENDGRSRTEREMAKRLDKYGVVVLRTTHRIGEGEAEVQDIND
ncbi:MAG: selenium cofactor biosynthesis protein YqeC [Negativicutes bacterium]|nr:selenium cofactor biosynthesis protein YqeC [Negativicutes bacterium]